MRKIYLERFAFIAFIVSLFLCNGATRTYAQQQSTFVDSTLSHTLFLDIDATAFFRDAEFFLPYTKGYTASGVRIAPTLCYGINEKATIRGGILLTAVAGSDKYGKVQPILSIHYKPFDWAEFIMGTIQGSTLHKMGVPMYDMERWYYDYKEDGLQLLTNTKHWESDTWLNWEELLEPWTPNQERFTLGTRQVAKFQLNRLALTVPLGFMGCHRGGQFSTLDTCIETLFNESAGFTANYEFHGSNVGFALPFYFYQKTTSTPERHIPFDKGWGVYPQLNFSTSGASNCLSVTCGYWYGYQYISPRGSYLFQSISWHDIDFAQQERHMITATINYVHSYKQLWLNLHTQFYYDTDHSALDLAIGVTMGWNSKFRLLTTNH